MDATRQKQLQQWTNIVLAWCQAAAIKELTLADSPVFANPTIKRV